LPERIKQARPSAQILTLGRKHWGSRREIFIGQQLQHGFHLSILAEIGRDLLAFATQATFRGAATLPK